MPRIMIWTSSGFRPLNAKLREEISLFCARVVADRLGDEPFSPSEVDVYWMKPEASYHASALALEVRFSVPSSLVKTMDQARFDRVRDDIARYLKVKYPFVGNVWMQPITGGRFISTEDVEDPLD